MQTLKASLEGLEKIRRAREKLTKQKGWAIDNEQWIEEASNFLPSYKLGKNTVPGTVSIGTWKRFLSGKSIKAPSFKAFCLVLGLDWEEVVAIEPQNSSNASSFVLPEKIAPVRKWVGRSQELNTLKSQLLNPNIRAISITAVCVVGLAGIGKTTLASQLIRQLHTENAAFAASAWESLRSVTGKPPRFDSIIDSLLSTLSNNEITPVVTVLDDYFQKTQRLINLLKDKPCIIVLDNVETVLKTKQAKRAGYFADDCTEYAWLFQQLVEAEHQSKVIFTSREILAQLQHTQSYTFQLKGLDLQAAIQLLKSFKLSATTKELADLAQRYQGHPKALEIIAAVIQEDFQGRLCTFLQDQKWLLVRDIENLIDEIINRLSEEEHTCLSQISVYQTPEYSLYYEGIAAQMPNVDDRDLKENTILALRRRQLLEFNAEYNCYQMHPLVQEKAAYLLNCDTSKKAHQQAYKYFISITKPKSEWQEFDDVKPLLRAYYHACQAQDWDTAALTLLIAYEFLSQKGHFDLLLDLYSELIPENWSNGEQLVTSAHLHADILCEVGYINFFLRQSENALKYLEQGLLLSRKTNNENIIVKALCYKGLNSLEEPAKAVEFLQEALQISQNHEDDIIKYRTLDYLGIAYQKLGKYEDARNVFQESLNVAQNIGFTEGEGIALGNLGNIYKELGEYNLSVEYLKQYLKIASSIGNTKFIEYALNCLSSVYNHLGEYTNAIDYAQKCIIATRNTGDRFIESFAMKNLGVAYRGSNESQKAIEVLRRCQELSHEINNSENEADTLYELGVTYQELQHIEEAIECFKASMNLFELIGNYSKKAQILVKIIQITSDINKLPPHIVQEHLI